MTAQPEQVIAQGTVEGVSDKEMALFKKHCSLGAKWQPVLPPNEGWKRTWCQRIAPTLFPTRVDSAHLEPGVYGVRMRVLGHTSIFYVTPISAFMYFSMLRHVLTQLPGDKRPIYFGGDEEDIPIVAVPSWAAQEVMEELRAVCQENVNTIESFRKQMVFLRTANNADEDPPPGKVALH